MSEVTAAFLIANVLRLLMVLIYIGAVGSAVMRRTRLGAATVPAALGAGLLALANIFALAINYWRLTAALSGSEALRHVAMVAGTVSYMDQAIAVIGAGLLCFAVFSGRSPTKGAA